MQKVITKVDSFFNKYNFYIVCFLCLCISLLALWFNQVAVIAYFCFVAVCALVYDTNKIIMLSSFGAFYAYCFHHNIFVVVLVLALFLRCVLLICLKKISIKKHIIIPLAIVAVLSIMLLFINLNKNNLFKTFLPFCLMLIIELYLLRDEIKLDSIVLSLVRLLAISCIVAITVDKLGIINHKVFYKDIFAIQRFYAWLPNVNSLSIWCIGLLSQLIFLFFAKKIGYFNFYFYALVVSIIGVLTISKTFFILCPLLIMCYLIYTIKKNWKLGLVQIAILVVIVIVVILHSQKFISVLEARFLRYGFNNLFDKLTTGRRRYWVNGLNAWAKSFKNTMFGLGGTFDYNLHNSFVEVLVRYGLVGLGCLITFVVYFVSIARKNAAKKFISFIPLLVVLLNMLVEEFSSGQFVVVALSLLALYNFKQEKTEKRVLYFNNTLVMGGTEIYMTNIIENLSEQFRFDVITFNQQDNADRTIVKRIKRCGVKIYYLNSRNKLTSCIKLMKFFIKNRNVYDIVHINATSKGMGIVAYLSRVYGKVDNVIYHSHMSGNDEKKNRVLEGVGQYLSKHYSTQFAACSQLASDYMFGKKFNEKHNVVLLKNTVDVDKFAYNRKLRDATRKALHLQNKFVVLHIGRFSKQKNQEQLISIFKEVYRNDKTARLIMVGDGIETAIEDKIKKLKLENVIKIYKKTNYVNLLMQASDVFVLPSLHEGLPIVAVEAQASGLPVVLSDNISKETDITGNCVFVELNKSNKSWAKAIIKSKTFSRKSENTSLLKEEGFNNQSAINEINEVYLYNN